MKIRIVSRPIAPPWDSGSMNMAFGVGKALSELGNKVYLPTVRGYCPDLPNLMVEEVYTSRNANLVQKCRLLLHLLTAPRATVLQFFLVPIPPLSSLMDKLARARSTLVVTTITHVPPPGQAPHSLGDCAVTYSAYLAEQMKAKNHRAVHIPPGVDEQAIHPGIDGSHYAAQLGIPSDVPVVLYGGELGHSATVDTLLQAIASLSADRPDIHFIFACRARNKYEQRRHQEVGLQLEGAAWGDRVHLLGQVDNMRELIARADLCILPLRDTYGKVDIPLFLLEAMAMAKPFVITEIPPLIELLEEPAGLAVPVNDADNLVAAMERLLSEGQAYGQRGRRVVEQKYALHQVAKRYQDLYRELLRERDSRLLY